MGKCGYFLYQLILRNLVNLSHQLYRVRNLPEPGCFIESQHEIHVLNGLPGSALYQIVDRRNQNKTVPGNIQLKADITKIGAADIAGVRQLVVGT